MSAHRPVAPKLPRAAATTLSRCVGHCKRSDLFQDVSITSQYAVDEADGRQGTALVAVAACAYEQQIRQPIDTNQRPWQHMIDRIIRWQVCGSRRSAAQMPL
jgi:hypothetical protein